MTKPCNIYQDPSPSEYGLELHLVQRFFPCHNTSMVEYYAIMLTYDSTNSTDCVTSQGVQIWQHEDITQYSKET